MRLYIREMLDGQKKEHISFHMPGHKRRGDDITELDYSDCLLSPHGAIAAAERDIAKILRSNRSFILTDGSTSGVFSMLYALKARGAGSLAFPVSSHRSVYNACRVLGLKPVIIPQETAEGIPRLTDTKAVKAAAEKADALFLTSPDYYGFLAPMSEAKEFCRIHAKPFLIDGAHGSHLHFTDMHAGNFADLWVDGVHKSLPALTQGAVVSCKTEEWTAALGEGVKTFRTTSPSYPIMASVEEAVKWPRNEEIERAAVRFKEKYSAVRNDDWTKVLIFFGEKADFAQKFLEEHGVYPEFNDGNYLLFYLSPCTKESELETLGKLLERIPRGEKKACKEGKIPIYSEGV